MSNVSVIVSYCSLDKRFIKPLLNQLLIFSDDIVLACFDKLLNGTHEELGDLDDVRKLSPEKIKTLCLPFVQGNKSRHYHNLARWEGVKYTKHDRILFLDADEIPEGGVFKSILDSNALEKFDAVDFACHWYFRSATNQAKQKEQCGLLIKRDLIKEEHMFTEHERWSYRHVRGLKYAPMVSTPQGPILHHYSWTRTKEEMLTKVSAWGHMNDKDWKSLIEKEFTHDFNGSDFVHGYSYNIVPDHFNIGI